MTVLKCEAAGGEGIQGNDGSHTVFECMYVCMYTALVTHQYVMQMEMENIIYLNRRCRMPRASIVYFSSLDL